PTLERLRDVALLVGVGVIGVGSINASVETAMALMIHKLAWQEAWHHWWTLAVGDGVGILEVAPLSFLGWSWLHHHGWRRWGSILHQRIERLIEWLVCGLLLVAVSVIVFCCSQTTAIAYYPLEYLPFPIMMWASLRFGQWGAVCSSLVVLGISLAGLLQGQGPFLAKSQSVREGALLLQTFIAAATITALVLAATVEERRQVEAKLRLALERERVATIQQEQLCQQVQRLNASLEQQVADRTAQLQARMEELKSFYEMKSVFTQAVSHDLRTSIIGTLMALRKMQHTHMNNGHSQVDCDVLNRMIAASDRQLTLITALSEDQLDQDAHLMLQRCPVQFADLVQQAIASLPPQLTDSQAVINCNLSPSLPLIIADVEKIKSVLQHLLTNAIKHNPSGVQVTVSATVEGDRLYCQVVDTGVGIAPEHQTGLFRPYVRNLQNPRCTGIGLGLYLCRQIVSAHGGDIGVCSEPGKGTTIWFTLPCGITMSDA
ncbi:MAG: MASE1 domain-containing protein, partial [Cyanobacteria bacterium]|nr:MASE1 domain-containing protein [Cyanobacteriota bacterium]MDW8201151.1 MASE1 domain-containing protein [Cyanobacteriota bacterium SKYGB_h_bin112]